MALQSDGQISFSNIAGELGSSTPYSLRGMSDFAGFSTPDSVSEFYGYDAGGGGPTLNQIWISGAYLNSPYDTCYRTAEFPAWHNGLFATPSVGDTVYGDSNGLSIIPPGYYGFDVDESDTTLEAMSINKRGEVTELFIC
jgi:hypothetical protein